MPRRRTQIERDEKIAEILDAAEQQVLEGGYPGLSVAGVARELGVAQNAIYWYFPSKDELFVAVLRRLLGAVTLPENLPEGTPAAKILQAVDRLGDLQWLRASLPERARKSKAVARFEREFRELVRGLLLQAFRKSLPTAQADTAVDAFMATTAGVYAQGLDPKQRRRVLRFALRRLLGEE